MLWLKKMREIVILIAEMLVKKEDELVNIITIIDSEILYLVF